jgi:hypothetical protein
MPAGLEILIVLAAMLMVAFWRAILTTLIAIAAVVVLVLICSGMFALVSIMHHV